MNTQMKNLSHMIPNCLSIANIDQRTAIILLKCLGNLKNIGNAKYTDLMEMTPLDQQKTIEIANFFAQNKILQNENYE
jgi:ERCC4-type nuclease